MNNAVKRQKQSPENYSPDMPVLAKMLEQAKMEKEYPSEFILPDKSTKFPPEVKHYGPAFVGFLNEFAYFLNYTGQGYGYIINGDRCNDRSYTIADVISGHAMQPVNFTTQPADDVTKEGIECLWKTAGFPLHHTFYADPSHKDYLSEADMKNLIRYTLCFTEQPVIVPQDYIGFFGSIIVGYKDNGNILLAYHFVPDFAAENNTIPQIKELSDWYNNDTSLFVAGKRIEMLSLEEIYRKGIFKIYDCLDSNINGDKRYYYDEWESYLRMNKSEMLEKARQIGYIPGGENANIDKTNTDEEIWNIICRSYDCTWCSMGERRYYVMHFLNQAAEHFSEVRDELQELASHFWNASNIISNKESGYNSEIGDDPVNSEILQKQDVRMRMADCVRRFREADEIGLKKIKTVLQKLEL